MIVSINQPCPFAAQYLWNRLLQSDKFIVLHNAQFIRKAKNTKATHNAYEILMQGKPYKMVIPVQHTDQDVALREARIDYDQKWQKKHLKTIEQSYRKRPCFDAVFPMIEALIGSQYETLGSFNTATYLTILAYFTKVSAVNQPTVDYDDDLVPERNEDPSHWMIELTEAAGGDTYLCGGLAVKEYLRTELFATRGLQVKTQEWTPIPYPQFTEYPFVPNLSIIDLLMSVGPSVTDYLKV
jgi:hypothetical protein